MLNKRTGLLLVILLAVLVIFLLIRYTKQSESNYRTELATIDTAAINGIDIRPPTAEEIHLRKKSGKWLVETGGKNYDADQASVLNLLNGLNGTPVKSVAATSKEHWKDFKTTDSSGTRIRLKHDGNVMDDLILGKFDYIQPKDQAPNPYMRQQQGEMLSYIRIADETPVYTVDGMLSLSIGKNADNYRNKILTKLDKKDISAVDINYSEGPSVNLKKVENSWILSNGKSDSASVAKYISGISNVRGKDFYNNQPEQENLFATLSITLSDNRSITLKVYTHSETDFLITSTQNPTNIINDKDGKLFEKLVVDKDQLEGKEKKEK